MPGGWILLTNGLVQQHLASAGNQGHGTGQVRPLHVGLQRLHDMLCALRAKPQALRVCANCVGIECHAVVPLSA